MDTGSRRIRKTAPRPSDKLDVIADITSALEISGHSLTLFDIRATGDLLLDVTFDNGKSSAKLASTQDGVFRPGTNAPVAILRNIKTPNGRFLYRVRLDTLKKTSKYFELLLGSDKFSEGTSISATFASLKVREIVPSQAEPQDLPRISITDDDDMTFMAGRDIVFGDLMRILHGAEVTTRFTIPYLTTLAIMADRFDCAQTVGNYVRARPKRFPWPQTYGNLTQPTEELLRQKILISWLLEDRVKLAAATKELILRGSSRWLGEEQKEQQAIWWDLQDGIEAELQVRRNLILSTVASLQGYFLALYSSKTQQCKLGYDSSPACDSYQLGEMVKFFINKGLLSLNSPLSIYEEYPEAYKEDIETLITKLRQCPTYQIDKNHGHCGLRTRIIPPLDYIQAMLTSNIGIDTQGWKNDWRSDSWEAAEGESFKFTRSMAGDTRLKMEGYLMPGKHAKALFTASAWDWSPEV